MTSITLELVQIRRSSTPGFRPGMNGSRPLLDGEQFINDADGLLRIGGVDGTFTDFVSGQVISGHTAAPDANYQVLVTDFQVGFANLTAPRIVILPDVDLYPAGTVLFIADESGQCSVARPITITVGPGTNDTIAGEPSIQITDRYQGIGLRRGAANVWIIAR